MYQTRLSLPFGIDDSVAAAYLCQQKKQWKMESTKQIRSIRPIRGQKSNPSSLPFREGPGVGILSGRGPGVGFPLTKREARLTKRACERLTKCEARLTHKKGVLGFQVQDTHNASCFTNMTWIGLNLSGWNVTRLFHFKVF